VPAAEQLPVPDGFRIEKFAEHAGNARILAVGPDGSVYVTRREQGDVLLFKVGPNGLAAGSPVRVLAYTEGFLDSFPSAGLSPKG